MYTYLEQLFRLNIHLVLLQQHLIFSTRNLFMDSFALETVPLLAEGAQSFPFDTVRLQLPPTVTVCRPAMVRIRNCQLCLVDGSVEEGLVEIGCHKLQLIKK